MATPGPHDERRRPCRTQDRDPRREKPPPGTARKEVGAVAASTVAAEARRHRDAGSVRDRARALGGGRVGGVQGTAGRVPPREERDRWQKYGGVRDRQKQLFANVLGRQRRGARNTRRGRRWCDRDGGGGPQVRIREN